MASFADLPGIALGVSPIQTARVYAALPAAGAWDTPLELFVSEAEFLTIHFSYLRGAAGGAFDWQLETSPYSVVGLVPAGAQEWGDPSVYQVGALVAGTEVASLTQEERITYTEEGAAAEMHVFGPVELRGNIERVRIRCRESGVVGTPGTLGITIHVR